MSHRMLVILFRTLLDRPFTSDLGHPIASCTAGLREDSHRTVKCRNRCKDANVCCADRQKPSFLLLRAHVNAFLIVVKFIFAAADVICFGHTRWQDRRRHQAIYSVWWGAGQGGPRSRLEEGTLLSPRRTPPASMRDHDLPSSMFPRLGLQFADTCLHVLSRIVRPARLGSSVCVHTCMAVN